MTAPGDARARVLGKIRSALGVAADGDARMQAVRERLETHPAGLVPARADKPKAERLALFVQMLEGQGATVVQAEDAADVPELEQAVITDQVRNGVAVRMAVLFLLLASGSELVDA